MRDQTGRNPLLSIIIPYYNTPIEYLQRAVNSIKCKESDPVEIIIVDDGSEKCKADLLEDLLQNASNIKILHKTNGGLSSARNYGVDNSRGDYITFVDDDDEVSENFIQEAKKYLAEREYDVVIGNLKIIDNKCEDAFIDAEYIFNIKNNDELYLSLIGINPRKLKFRVSGSACGKLIRAELARKVRFDENVKLYEDQLYNRVLFDVAEKVVLVPCIWYYYYQREGSMMHPDKKEILIKNEETYWDGLYKLMTISPPKRMSMYGYEAFIHIDNYAHSLALNGKYSWREKMEKLREYYDMKAIKNGLKTLSLLSVYLNAKKRVLLFLVRNRFLNAFFILKFLVRNRHDHK